MSMIRLTVSRKVPTARIMRIINTSTSRQDGIAWLAIGTETCDDSPSEVSQRSRRRVRFAVYPNAVTCPAGRCGHRTGRPFPSSAPSLP
jgi:hypothetical protein